MHEYDVKMWCSLRCSYCPCVCVNFEHSKAPGPEPWAWLPPVSLCVCVLSSHIVQDCLMLWFKLWQFTPHVSSHVTLDFEYPHSDIIVWVWYSLSLFIIYSWSSYMQKTDIFFQRSLSESMLWHSWKWGQFFFFLFFPNVLYFNYATFTWWSFKENVLFFCIQLDESD